MTDDITPFARFDGVILDCPDPGELGRFYNAMIGGILKVDDDWASIQLQEGVPWLQFQLAPNFVAPTWPDFDTVPQQIHIDLLVRDIDDAEPKALALGARPTGRPDDPQRTFRVYLDPAGHPFCLVWG